MDKINSVPTDRELKDEARSKRNRELLTEWMRPNIHFSATQIANVRATYLRAVEFLKSRKYKPTDVYDDEFKDIYYKFLPLIDDLKRATRQRKLTTEERLLLYKTSPEIMEADFTNWFDHCLVYSVSIKDYNVKRLLDRVSFALTQPCNFLSYFESGLKPISFDSKFKKRE